MGRHIPFFDSRGGGFSSSGRSMPILLKFHEAGACVVTIPRGVNTEYVADDEARGGSSNSSGSETPGIWRSSGLPAPV